MPIALRRAGAPPSGFREPADGFWTASQGCAEFDGPEFSLPPAEGPSPTILVPAPLIHAR
ncbi:MAG TPA: hypothetical protein VE777_11955 [Gaiellales bacterium]|nr:hypothetical protein [Gaiellales bacterium]